MSRKLTGPAAARARKSLAESNSGTLMPGLSSMTRKQMAKALQSIWGLCDEMHVPTHNGTRLETHFPPKNGGMSLYGRVYTAIVRRAEWHPNR